MKVLNFGSLNLDYVYSVDHMVTPGETLSVNWDGKIQCQVNVPETAISDQQLLLPCTPQK